MLKKIFIISFFISFTSILFSQNTYTVTNVNNEGAGSLNQAITDANTNGGGDIIIFNIPGDGPHTIQLTSGLPEIFDELSILGYTQPSSTKATDSTTANIKIELDGSDSGEDEFGLMITGSNCIVEGLVINSFGRGGIYVSGSNNIIKGNYIGISVDGTEPKGNGFRSSDENFYDGIWLDGPNNQIGGTDISDRNVISCNAYSNIYIYNSEATGNTIKGNFIGPDATGTLMLENQSDGIVCFGGSNNIFGGIEEGSGNVISGNGYTGMYFETEDGANTIQGNYIGTDVTGTNELGNLGVGIGIALGKGFIIGGSQEGAGNIISGNGFDDGSGGIGLITSCTDNLIQGNFIGTNINGNVAIPNLSYGIFIKDSENNIIGGSINGEGNVISGNEETGILLNSASNNNIMGNIIGLDKTGSTSLANKFSGIELFASSANTIGSKNLEERNIISGNESDGVRTFSSTSNENVIIGNYIGTNKEGNEFVPNAFDGIAIYGSANTKIGGKEIGEGNIIAGNERNGVLIKTTSELESALLKDANEEIFTSKKTLKKHVGIKNTNTFTSSKILTRFFKTKQIAIADSGNSNSVLGNKIYNNMTNGIDLFGVDRINDEEDSDSGPNSGQNHPDIDGFTSDESNVTISYSVNSSTNNSAYPLYVEFFKADSSGQGKTLIGSDTYESTDALLNKFATFSSLANLNENDSIVATATDNDGNTSEFSDPYTVTSVVGIEKENITPNNYYLSQNYPNPFNPVTTIKYSIPIEVKNEKANVNLVVFDILGKTVTNLVKKHQNAGNYSVEFNATTLTSGIYYYQLTVGEFLQTKKMMLIK